MALKPKNGTFQLRLDSDLLERFHQVCELNGDTASYVVRKFIEGVVAGAEKRARAAVDRENRPGEAGSGASGGQVSVEPEKRPVELSRQPQSLSERRAVQKEAKRLKKQRREDRFLS